MSEAIALPTDPKTSLISECSDGNIYFSCLLLNLGFCKNCFSLISGLSAIAFVSAGPDYIDMTVFTEIGGINPRIGWAQIEFTGWDRPIDRDHPVGVGG